MKSRRRHDSRRDAGATSVARAAAVLAVLLVLSFASGCRQDMHNQPKYIPLRATTFFPDGRSQRPLVQGTVPRGELRDDPGFYTGMIGDNLLDTLPVRLDQKLLQRGQERFNIYCAPCHSVLGDGQGMIAKRGYLRPPSFHDERLRNAPLGHLYRVITYGTGAMPDYAQQIAPADRWAIVAYIRALQLSQAANVSEVPESERSHVGQSLPPIETVTGKTGPKGTAPMRPVAPKPEGGEKK